MPPSNAQELEGVDVMLEDCLGQLRPCRERLVCRAVWRDGAPGRITEEPVWPNPESQAWQQQGWENRAIGTKDANPPPPPDPAVGQHIILRCAAKALSHYLSHTTRLAHSVCACRSWRLSMLDRTTFATLLAQQLAWAVTVTQTCKRTSALRRSVGRPWLLF